MVVHLEQNRDLDELLARSRTDSVIIFKHSTQCAISDAVYEEFIRFAASIDDLPCGLVLVIESRALSTTIASRFGIRHESPQVIVVKDGLPTWNASHWSITTDSLIEALR